MRLAQNRTARPSRSQGTVRGICGLRNLSERTKGRDELREGQSPKNIEHLGSCRNVEGADAWSAVGTLEGKPS